MAQKQKAKLPAPRIEFWVNSKKEFNYRTIGENGKVIGGHNQGFKNLAGLKKNIIANGKFYGTLLYYANNLPPTGAVGFFSGKFCSLEIPLFKIPAPK